MGWRRLVCTADFTSYSDGYLKIILSEADMLHIGAGFHRKRVGLNHLALYAISRSEVDRFYDEILKPSEIASLYQEGPAGNDDYYSVLFEDPDRMKLEVVFAPRYCVEDCWPNNIESDFDPYKSV